MFSYDIERSMGIVVSTYLKVSYKVLLVKMVDFYLGAFEDSVIDLFRKRSSYGYQILTTSTLDDRIIQEASNEIKKPIKRLCGLLPRKILCRLPIYNPLYNTKVIDVTNKKFICKTYDSNKFKEDVPYKMIIENHEFESWVSFYPQIEGYEWFAYPIKESKRFKRVTETEKLLLEQYRNRRVEQFGIKLCVPEITEIILQ